MRKSSLFKEEDDVKNCLFCGETAQLMCGKCEEAYYCKYDHQRADWNRHSKTCKSIDEKRNDHFENKRMRKSEIFEYVAKPDILKGIGVTSKLIQGEKLFIEKRQQSDIQAEIELGSSTCVIIRLYIASKQFSTAQDILHEYFKQKNSFLNDTSNIASKESLQLLDPQTKKRHIYLISGKLRLISTLANLMHELIRNSVDMFQILITHIDRIYGNDSMQLSNAYFYTANYLNFLNQSTKALACFLKAAKIRKNRGGTAYFNVACLLLKSNRKKKALQYFQKALQLLQQQKNPQNKDVIPQIFQSVALIYMQLGIPKSMMDYFQKAYFHYHRANNRPKAEAIMNLFLLIRNQSKQEGSEDIKAIQFVKERKDKKPGMALSSKNYDNFKKADKSSEDDEKKTFQWISSFKQLKSNFNQPSLIKYPAKELQYLFGTDSNKNGQQQAPSYLDAENNSFGLSQGVNMDLNYMRTLHSNQVGYLHQLNRLLMQCRQRAAVYDIVQNSNFYQAVDQQRLNRFYKLNPGLVRPSDLNRRTSLLENVEENEQQYQFDAVQEPKKMMTPKLDLTKLKDYRNN